MLALFCKIEPVDVITDLHWPRWVGAHVSGMTNGRTVIYKRDMLTVYSIILVSYYVKY